MLTGSFALGALAAGAAYFAGQLRGSGAPCICEVRGDAQPLDRDLVALLARQLERCGPANLTSVAPPPPEEGASWGTAVLLLGWVAGLVTAAAVFRGLRQRVVTGTPVSLGEEPAASRTPPRGAVTRSTRRALRDGDPLA